jgi:hypothetical protein
MAKPVEIQSQHGERFPQRILLPNARTFVNVMQHLRHFRRFEMNKGDLGRQREGRILVAEKKFFTKLMFVVWLRVQNAAQEIRRNRGILNRVPLSWAAACTANNGRHFEQLL